MAAHAASRDITGRKELENTIGWKSYMGKNVRRDNVSTFMQQTLYEADDPALKEGGWTLEVEIMETTDETLGHDDGRNASAKGIVRSKLWEINISRDMAEKISRCPKGSKRGFYQLEGCDEWQLDFDYELRYRWAGMLQFFEVRILHGGYKKGYGQDRFSTFRTMLTGDCAVAADAGNNA